MARRYTSMLPYKQELAVAHEENGSSGSTKAPQHTEEGQEEPTRPPQRAACWNRGDRQGRQHVTPGRPGGRAPLLNMSNLTLKDVISNCPGGVQDQTNGPGDVKDHTARQGAHIGTERKGPASAQGQGSAGRQEKSQQGKRPARAPEQEPNKSS